MDDLPALLGRQRDGHNVLHSVTETQRPEASWASFKLRRVIRQAFVLASCRTITCYGLQNAREFQNAFY